MKKERCKQRMRMIIKRPIMVSRNKKTNNNKNKHKKNLERS